MKIQSLAYLLLCLVLASCGRAQNKIFRVYSPDKRQCITFMDIGSIRYIFPGSGNSVPDTNYLKLDISTVPELGEEVAGCWRSNTYEWKLIIDNAKIVEDKLDSTRFVFSNHLPINKNLGITSVKEFEQEDCYHFGTYYMSVVPPDSAIIER